MTEDASSSSLATAELVGALTYGQLRAFQVTANAIRCAPTIGLANEVASFAVREHERYQQLRAHLQSLTDLSERVIERQRARFDDFFDGLAMQDWVQATTFFAVGLPIAADFTRAVAAVVDEETADVLVGTLADRKDFEQFALDQLRLVLESEDGDMERLRHLVADVVGRALTGFQAGMADSDALKILLEAAEEEGVAVKDLAIDVLHAHRKRMIAMGLDELE